MSGAAIGGFGVGLAQGLKLGTDIVDSAARREVMGKQAKLADLEIAEKQKTVDLQTDISNTVAEFTGSRPLAPNAQPKGAAAPDQSPSAAAPTPAATGEGGAIAMPVPAQADAPSAATGISTPAAAPAPQRLMPDGKKFDPNNFGHQEILASTINAKLVAAGKISPFQAAQEMIKWNDLKNENAIRAAQVFQRTGDSALALEKFNQSGFQLPEGTTFSIVQTPSYPGAKPADNVVVTTPDGKKIDLHSLLLGALNPKELLDYKSKEAYQSADIAAKLSAEQGLRQYRADSIKLQQENAKETVRYHNSVLKNQTDTLQANLDRYVRDDIVKENEVARKEIAMLFNYVPLSDEKFGMLAPEEKKSYFSKESNFVLGKTIFDMNIDRTKEGMGKATLTPTDVRQILTKGLNQETKTDDDGRTYITFNGKNVWVPDLRASTPPPASAAPKPGIAPPPPLPPGVDPSVETRAAGIRDAEAAARVRQQEEAAAAKAQKTQMTTEAAGLTPDRISVLTGPEARELESRYWNVLTSDQKMLLRRRANNPK